MGSLKGLGPLSSPLPTPPGPTEDAQTTGTVQPGPCSEFNWEMKTNKKCVCSSPLNLPLSMAERQPEKPVIGGSPASSHEPLGMSSCPCCRQAPLEEGPGQILPAGARAPLLSDPVLPALILQGKQLSNHRWDERAALCLESCPCIFCSLSEIFLFRVTGKIH